MQNDYEGAQQTLEDAMAEFQSLGDRLGTAQCLHRLGDIKCTQKDFDGAREALEEAMGVFESLGSTPSAAQCLQSLDKLQCMEGNGLDNI